MKQCQKVTLLRLALLFKMKKLMTLLLYCHVSFAVKRSMTLYLLGSSGVPNVPEFEAIADVEGEIMTYYDSDIKKIEPRQGWVRKFMEHDTHHWETNTQDCMHYQQLFKDEGDSLKKHLNQTGGVHVRQQIVSCEWDDETEEVSGYNHNRYNGEDFLKFDLETETWIAENSQAEIIKQEWDKNKALNGYWKNFLTVTCPEWLKKYFKNGQSYLERRERPSVSLLQKTSSSPVSCHASGFYPDRASLIWRKDGEEIHEDVDHGEILPNHDGTFQMSVDLNLSSVTPEDWRRYECVFQLSGVKDDIVTRLDKDVIRTNEVKPSDVTIPIIVAVVVFALVFIAATGFIVYRRKKDNLPPSSPGTSELSEKLNPET